jgi:nicotinic acid mononucleotide adenylyltransferase
MNPLNEVSLWQILGIPEGTIYSEIDRLYLQNPRKDLIDERRAWKILRDPFYNDLYCNYSSISVIEAAGFFDNGLSVEASLKRSNNNLFTTPVDKILKNLAKEKEPTVFQKNIVLLTTGGFSPIHAGHVAMMKRAKLRLEKAGYRVVGGYISPSHDKYVSVKNNGSAELDSAHRIDLCEDAVLDSDWLMVDSWESRYNTHSINYTDVVLRLKRYLDHHIPTASIQVAYVFGGDNYGFARTFIKQGIGVCMTRTGYEAQIENLKKEPFIKNSPNIFFGKVSSQESGLSSTQMRLGLLKGLPDRLVHHFKRLTVEQKNLAEALYVVRDDSTWGLSQWSFKNKEKATKAAVKFLQSLVGSIKNSFLNVKSPENPILIKELIYSLTDQIEYVRNLSQEERVINLDVCSGGAARLGFSRLFSLADGQKKSNNLIARPGSPKIKAQFKAIKAGQYVLVEDDIATGWTINQIKKCLPKEVKIKSIKTLTEYCFYQKFDKTTQHVFHDIVDLRDFMIGSKDAGLVVSLPNGQTARVPYMLPYVRLANRAKIPPSNELLFSYNMWNANLEFFNEFPELTVDQSDEYFKNLIIYLGFNKTDSLKSVCEWHLAQLQPLLK